MPIASDVAIADELLAIAITLAPRVDVLPDPHDPRFGEVRRRLAERLARDLGPELDALDEAMDLELALTVLWAGVERHVTGR